MYQLPQCVPEPDGLTRPARPAVGALHEYKLAHEAVSAERWQHIFAVLREESVNFQAKIVRLVRRLNNDGRGLDDDDLEQLAWDKREEWEAAEYVPPAAGRRFHDTLDGLAAGDLVFEEEQP